MPFVPYGTSVPSLNAWQFSFEGLTFGGKSGNYQLGPGGVQGLGLANIESGDVVRPLANGEFPGYDAASGRDIVIQLVVSGATPAAVDANILALAAVMQPQQTIEYPLFMQKGGGTTYAVMARPRKFAYSADYQYVQTFFTIATIQFHVTDWRIYTTTQQASNTFSATAGNVSCAVGGGVAVNPVIVVTAGSAGCSPVIGVASGVSQFLLDFTLLVMAAGSTLSIDTDFQTAIYTPAGGVGTSALAKLAYSPPEWGPLIANATAVLSFTDFSLGGGTSTAAIQWANGYAAI